MPGGRLTHSRTATLCRLFVEPFLRQLRVVLAQLKQPPPGGIAVSDVRSVTLTVMSRPVPDNAGMALTTSNQDVLAAIERGMHARDDWLQEPRRGSTASS
jgi:hypothetical protein